MYGLERRLRPPCAAAINADCLHRWEKAFLLLPRLPPSPSVRLGSPPPQIASVERAMALVLAPAFITRPAA